MASSLTFAGKKRFLEGGLGQQLTKDDDIVCAVGDTLPELLDVTIHKGVKLWRPTFASLIKFDPYVCAYLSGKKNAKQMTPKKRFAMSEPTFNHTFSFAYLGEPLLVIQAYDSDMLRNEFIGECPLDLLPIINTNSRTWTGPATMYGLKGTVDRGEVWITISFRGGTPFKPEAPALHFRETPTFAELKANTTQAKIKSVFSPSNKDSSAKRSKASCGATCGCC